MENVDFSFKEGFEDTTFLYTGRYDRIRLKNLTVRNGKCDHLIKSWDEDGKDKIEFINLKCHLDDDKLVKCTDEVFDYKAI